MNTQHEKKRVAIYLRVSTTSQAEKGCGLDLQMTACQAMADLKNWKVVKVYKDEGISGTLDEKERLGLKSLLDDSEDDIFDLVIFYAMDRLGRNAYLIARIIQELEDNDVFVISTKEMLDSSTPHGKFIVQITSGLAEMDRTHIVERMKKGKEEAKKKRGYVGGYLPYGYHKNTKNKNSKIKVQKREAEILKYIFELLDAGYNKSQITNKLNELGISSRMGTKWSRASLGKIVKRRSDYEGGLIHQNENNIRWPKII